MRDVKSTVLEVLQQNGTPMTARDVAIANPKLVLESARRALRQLSDAGKLSAEEQIINGRSTQVYYIKPNGSNGHIKPSALSTTNTMDIARQLGDVIAQIENLRIKKEELLAKLSEYVAALS